MAHPRPPRPLLVIDDEPHIWRLLDINLADGGFAVRNATTLAAARAELAAQVESLPGAPPRSAA